jgi:glutamate-1-semialdehyde 2,1-aminomutase
MKDTQQLYEFAQRFIPGGVSASARANAALGRPFYVSCGDGPLIYDLEGRPYVDLSMSHGASLLGHNHPRIREAVTRALDLGIICAYETEHQSALAEKICELVPCAEMVRFAGSGTETLMYAVRLARAYTGRTKVIKFEGHFHGYSDQVFYSSAPPLAEAGPADAPTPYAQSAGMLAELDATVVIVPFNDPAALEAAFAVHGAAAATLVLEPVNYDSGCILPEPGFLELCRSLCDRYGVVLTYDEVLTAFRFSAGGAQAYYGVKPDLCVLGKAIGAGMPISALAGRRDIMRELRPVGRSEHSGTYLAHLTAVLAARAALEEYSRPGFYERLAALGDRFYSGFNQLILASGVPIVLQHLGPRFGLYFGLTDRVTNYRESARQDRAMMATFIAGCIARGVYVNVSPHHGFSAAHTDADLDRALEGIEGALGDVRRLHAGGR